MNTLFYMTFSNTLLLQYLMLPLVHPKALHIPMQQEEQHWPKLEKKEVGPSVEGNRKSHFFIINLLFQMLQTRLRDIFIAGKNVFDDKKLQTLHYTTLT